eukprot:TRINITY_DN26188_c0_g1_i1.p1 TRINITY_DN26188_c0_g1~~TRINITY_DN26188_c0_g1_i1.p1  ORF type:complete len:2149 (+),score=434.34 TRINITY_DN26188_c0_g1_i1:43-6489(+)
MAVAAPLGFAALPVPLQVPAAQHVGGRSATLGLARGDFSAVPADSASVVTSLALAGGAVLGAAYARRRRQGGTHVKRSTTRTGSTLVKAQGGDSSYDGGARALERYVKERGGNKVIRKILIANNGMAATKAILSMRQWGYLELGHESVFEFVVMATPEDLDANSEFIRLANTYVEVPGGKNVNNYANVDVICEVAKAYGVDAVWPGWGHASENPKLPTKLKELGIVFIGPTAPVMSVLGDKIAANILAQTAGVCSIPWSGDGLEANLGEDGTIPDEIFQQGTINSVDEAIACAERIGYPVMLKASEGGGGKGIRMCANREEIEAGYPQVISEAPPGSPVFMMQLCQGARHIEVQIVGDMHGNAVALNGRDCSTQRRFQKIFEEGPPTIVPKETFTQMERAAQRLTQNIGYIGAGTVEYLYNAKDNEFFFLELNPRLQVEHPVTEEISGVNLPATQLQVLMGIPLQNIPQIRKFYGKDSNDTVSNINFMEDEYIYPTKHVIAARITAENPDDAFKPTSGKIKRIKFQSSVACWGYFAIGANGAIHEYADSQFGHIFAHGENREDARKALVVALRNMYVEGAIRNPVEYLVELLGTDAFKENDIDTSWLDGILKDRLVGVKYNNADVVLYAAIFRAMKTLKGRDEEMLAALAMSQVGPVQRIGDANSLAVEITFEGYKYKFQVVRRGPDLLQLTLGTQRIDAKVREQPDGAIFVTIGSSAMQIFGTEEALGLRLTMEGVATVMLPTIFDASELRSEFNGKVVRYLQENGGHVKVGEPYVELEAMKMIMPVKATASGRIKHLGAAGSIVAAGDLIGQLELDDPLSSQKIEQFTGRLEPTAFRTPAPAGEEEDLKSQLDLVLAGYLPREPTPTLVQELLAETPPDAAFEVVTDILEQYLSVEEKFAALAKEHVKGYDQQLLALSVQYKDNLAELAALALAHSQLKMRNEVVLSTLRSVSWRNPRDGNERFENAVARLVELPDHQGYDEVVLLAKQVMEGLAAAPFTERQRKLRALLHAEDVDFEALSNLSASACGVELLGGLMGDESAEVRRNALEAYVRRVYRSYRISELSIVDKGPSNLSCHFTYQHTNVSGGAAPVREGYCTVAPSLEVVPDILKQLPLTGTDPAVNNLEIVIGPDAFPSVRERNTFYSTEDEFRKMIPQVEVWLQDANDELQKSKVRHVVITQMQPPWVPRHACFNLDNGWKEDNSRRDMRPSFPHLLEVGRLAESFELERIVPTIGRNSQVFLGSKWGAKGGKRGPPKTVFVRMISQTLKSKTLDEEAWTNGPETLLLSALDELERARLNPNVGQQPNSNIFANFMVNVDLPAEVVNERFEDLLRNFATTHGQRLQRMKVDEIVLKVGVGSPRAGRSETLRVTASSSNGEYLDIYGLAESEDPITGRPIHWKDVRTGEAASLDAAQDHLAGRRNAARAAGSTYAFEFLGMMKLDLLARWNKYVERLGDGAEVPLNVFKSQELVTGDDGELFLSDRAPGCNDIGMIAWRCTLRTPEYPDGRSIVLIANDVTHKAGSFGVAEDIFFQKASAYARENGLPRLYIACNSGARVGLVEELKPYLKAKWIDDANPAKGFEYLYLEEEDYNRFEEGTVLAHEVTDASGAKHYALDAVLGLGQESTAGGIGVENLQGSGLIAGETSRAYNEVFTLSYITGRSVGIGAYLNRLGQRTIQMVNGPMILTGFGALNKLLGRPVYTSQDQLGGPQVMLPNGVTHELVRNDAEGVTAMLDWLSYVPRTCWSPPPLIVPADPPDRAIQFMPTKAPYDPRHMLAGTTTSEGIELSGFFDAGSFKEYLPGWGRSVVIGRGKLGGIPMGAIAVETRNVERIVPADPANPASQSVIEPQAGQVWFPDSAFKTATAIRDFNRGENLPLIIFANWRGFSGGTRDMYQEVLKFGAQIVDALVDYEQPVFIYIPPGGELRGGSWVVVDPSINSDQMEMYADVESRGGVLEPAGIVEVKFREPQRAELMHRLDPELRRLDGILESTAYSEVGANAEEIRRQIRAREDELQAVYTQIACEFADLHDRAGRMQAKHVIRGALEWRNSREFFYWRVQRRLLEQEVINRLMTADPELSKRHAMAMVASWCPADIVANDKSVVEFLKMNDLKEEIEGVRVAALKRRIAALYEELPTTEQQQLNAQ